MFVYMVQCSDGSLYTGWTTDPAARLTAHNTGKGARYTRSRRPVQFKYLEEVPDKSAALRRERALKALTRAQKLQLVAAADLSKWSALLPEENAHRDGPDGRATRREGEAL